MFAVQRCVFARQGEALVGVIRRRRYGCSGSAQSLTDMGASGYRELHQCSKMGKLLATMLIDQWTVWRACCSWKCEVAGLLTR